MTDAREKVLRIAEWHDKESARLQEAANSYTNQDCAFACEYRAEAKFHVNAATSIRESLAAPSESRAGGWVSNDLQKRIRDQMKTWGSYRKLAAILGCDHAYLYCLSTGKKDNPSPELLAKLGLRRIVTVTYEDAI